MESAAQGGVDALDQVAGYLSNVSFDSGQDRLMPLSPFVPAVLNIGFNSIVIVCFDCVIRHAR